MDIVAVLVYIYSMARLICLWNENFMIGTRHQSIPNTVVDGVPWLVNKQTYTLAMVLL